MNIKFADLIVKTSVDYNDEVVKALENAGFIVTMVDETYTEMSFEVTYIVAKAESEEE